MNLTRFNKDEGGSAMTEFVIGLPIFIIIFSGLGSLYQVGYLKLDAIGDANAQLWDNAQNDPPIESYTPLGNLDGITDGGWGNAAISLANASGTYGESYAKVKLSSYIPGSDVDPEYNVVTITGLKKESPTNILLDDQPFNTNGVSLNSVTSAVNSLLSIAGGRLALGAGIRYGSETGSSTGESVTTAFGSYTADPITLELPRNTAATHRLIPVALVRLAVAENEALDASIVEFLMDADNDEGKPDWAADDSKAVDDPTVDADCDQDQAQDDYNDCMSDALPSSGGPYTTQQRENAEAQCTQNTSC